MLPPLQLTRADLHERLLGGAMSLSRLQTEHMQSGVVFFGSSGSSSFFSALADTRFVEEILSYSGLQSPGLDLVRNGQYVARAAFTKDVPYSNGSFKEAVDPACVVDHYQRGYTVVTRALHLHSKRFFRFSRILEQFFFRRVRVNSYLTPGLQQGFKPHYDNHDVIVLQISGSKEWSFYANNFPRPTDATKFNQTQLDVGTVVSARVLRPGDALFVPRGVSHAAKALDESLHLTIGIQNTTLQDVLGGLFRGLGADEAARADANIRSALQDSDERMHLVARLRDILDRSLEDETLQKTLFRLATDYSRSRRRPVVGLLNTDQNTSDSFILNDEAIWFLEPQDDEACLVVFGEELHLNALEAKAVRFIERTGRIDVDGLSIPFPHLNSTQLIANLLKIGFLLRLADSSPVGGL